MAQERRRRVAAHGARLYPRRRALPGRAHSRLKRRLHVLDGLAQIGTDPAILHPVGDAFRTDWRRARRPHTMGNNHRQVALSPATAPELKSIAPAATERNTHGSSLIPLELSGGARWGAQRNPRPFVGVDMLCRSATSSGGITPGAPTSRMDEPARRWTPRLRISVRATTEKRVLPRAARGPPPRPLPVANCGKNLAG